MGFFNASGTGLRKYAAFSGRASLSEFWWFALFDGANPDEFDQMKKQVLVG